MPKRTAKEKIEYYKNKIRRLETKPRRRIRRLSSSSDSDQNTSSRDIEEPSSARASTDLEQEAEFIVPEVLTDQICIENEAAIPEVADLDPNILAALGETTDESPEFGEKIHENLTKIWLPLLKKGMTKENREIFLKNYLIPENCILLQAPTLNPEISAAISEPGRLRDKKMTATQQQLGVGITAINRGLHLLINNESRVEAIKFISDGCRILSDLHHQKTETRIKFILPGLDKSFLQFLDRTERDQTLFGSNLSEKIKASKTIAKQGEQIKKNLPPTKNTSFSTRVLQPTNNRPGYQGNWQGPSRFQSHRGGRGGHKRTSNRTPPAPSHPKSNHSQKPRAHTRR